MRRPKARNVAIGFLVGVMIVAVALVIAQDQETIRVRVPIATGDERFPEYLSRLLGSPLTSGDSYEVRTNGDSAFPAMLAAIDGAVHRVSMETYIFDTGRIAEGFTSALERAARRGVAVRIVFDAIGAQEIDAAQLERLEHAGCKIGWFNPVSSYSLEEVNYRTHRKALVVDGAIAFVGGMGIADQWAFDTGDAPRWRDTQIELTGPAAVNVEAAFNENWIETGGIVEPDLLRHEDAPTGSAKSIVVWSSPEGGTNRMKLLYLLAIAAARHTLDIQSPYFISDTSTGWSLQEAARRGVRIRILTEGDMTDAKPVKFAARADYESLLRQGFAIYEYQPAMMHAKAMIVDGLLSIVGSSNFDNRSLELNDELNVAVFDRAFTERLSSDFERDLTRSQRLDLEEWRARPLYIRARERIWGYFGEVF